MRSIESRVGELEKRAGTDADQHTVLIVSFLRPGPIQEETLAYSTIPGGKGDADAQRWDRQPGETLEQLEERATREVPRNARSVPVLFERYAGD